MAETGEKPTVILGAGFAGIEVARALGAAGLPVVLIDRQNHHLFQPLLYQVATAALSPADIATASRALLRHQPNVGVLMAEVTGVDADRRLVHLAHRRPCRIGKPFARSGVKDPRQSALRSHFIQSPPDGFGDEGDDGVHQAQGAVEDDG